MTWIQNIRTIERHLVRVEAVDLTNENCKGCHYFSKQIASPILDYDHCVLLRSWQLDFSGETLHCEPINELCPLRSFISCMKEKGVL
jgi:hypothetical protein